MTRLTRLLIGASLVAAMVLGTVAVAYAAPVLTLTPTKAAVTYPQPTWLKLVSADGTAAVATTVTIQYRSIGSDTWKKLRTVSAARTGEGTVTVPVSPKILSSITGFRAIAEGLESEVTTVAVKARLSAAIAPGSVKAGRSFTMKGFIWPRHAVGSTPVEVNLWKWEDGVWVLKDTLHPRVVGKTTDGSKWQAAYRFQTSDKGKWRVQVSHEDMKHAASTSKFSFIRVR